MTLAPARLSARAGTDCPQRQCNPGRARPGSPERPRLAQMLGSREGKGTATGIDSMLLGLGALCGSWLTSVAGKLWRIDGLLLATALLAVLALLLISRIAVMGMPVSRRCHEHS